MGYSDNESALLDYIVKAKKLNNHDEVIKESLRKVGWEEEEISKGFKIIDQ